MPFLLFIFIFLFCRSNIIYSDNKESNASPQFSITGKSVLNSDDEFACSLAGGCREYKIMIMKYNTQAGEKEVFSMYTPYALIGRIKTTGLLREIKNPVSYKPVSSVYYESVSIKSNEALKNNANTGYNLGPLCGFSLFGIKSESSEDADYDMEGAYYSGKTDTVRGRFLLNSILTISKEKNDGFKDIWYFDRFTGYGRKIRHAAVSSVYSESAGDLGFAAGISEIESSSTGYFIRFSPVLKTPFARIYALYAYSDRCYVVPGGSYPGIKDRKGFAAVLKPVKSAEINLSYYTDFYHRKHSDINYTGMTEKIAAGIVIDPSFLTLKFKWENSRNFRLDVFDMNDSLIFYSGIQSDNAKISAEKKLIIEKGEKISDSITVAAGVRKGNFDWYMAGKYKITEDIEKNLKNRIRVKHNDISVYVEHSRESINKKMKNPALIKNLYTVGVEAKY